MTATLYPSQRTDRVTPRPIGDAWDGVPTSVADRTHRSANYAARRAVAALLGVLVVVGVAVGGAELLGSLVDVGGRHVVASAGSASDVSAAQIHVAQPGDTLWSIADRYRGDVGHGRFVDALIDINGGTVIQIGQAVRLP